MALLAYRNSRNRFFLPSKKNSFGGFYVSYVMVDTGCNTTLLPLQQGDLLKLGTIFPTSEYTWKITGGGVAALQSPVLSISHREQKEITVKLCEDVNEFEARITDLRFHLCYEDACDLLSIKQTDTTSILIGSHILQKFKTVIEKVKKVDAQMKLAERRTHALLGQTIIGKHNLYQIRFVTIITSLPVADIFTEQQLDKYEDHCRKWIDSSFARGMEEFKDLEDDDHDNDHVVVMSIDGAVDF
eukprot:TRINITY_DN6073_c0_g2_i1.p1 TRINITY_DN6073_c0_g2~~TRINITY_DN6073_c0_g2_i1.p1  ORF type:complete len:243 (+),score=21.28 TRINITY_DN6073_c0_g2_i1:92-820(+)